MKIADGCLLYLESITSISTLQLYGSDLRLVRNIDLNLHANASLWFDESRGLLYVDQWKSLSIYHMMHRIKLPLLSLN